MTIQSYQILQRDTDDQAHVRLKSGESIKLPVGGPYTVDDAHDVFVGDLWILAGQSNMEGIGDLIDVEQPSPFVHSYQSREQWAIAEEPLHWLDESPRLVHHRIQYGRDVLPDVLPPRDPLRSKGAGLGISFGKELYSLSGVPIGLIPCAHAGTSMEQWSPNLCDEGGNSLYGATLQRFHSVGNKVAGILWYQGEAEASPELVAQYSERMTALVDAFRADFKQPDLPFYYVQIGRVLQAESLGWTWNRDGWHEIRERQRVWRTNNAHTEMVASIDLELDDLIHIGTQGLKRLGKRLARAVTGQRTPEIATIQLEKENSCLRLLFQNVQGNLQALGRPSGFTLRDAQDKKLSIIYKITLEENTVLLHLTENALPSKSNLWYGWGLDPYCNITDASDAALPAFGPIPIH